MGRLASWAYTAHTMSASPPRLFVPGDGALPPALVGRSAAQAVLCRCLDDLVRGAAPPHNVVLVGPRGNGKTALLSWFKTVCGSASGVDVLWLTPGEIADVDALIGAVAPRRGIARLLPRKVGIAAVDLAEWSPSQERNVRRALLARCRRKPVDAADRFATLEGLNRLGYVWCPPGQGAAMAWSAGIPSLMKYVLDQAGPNPSGGAP